MKHATTKMIVNAANAMYKMQDDEGKKKMLKDLNRLPLLLAEAAVAHTQRTIDGLEQALTTWPADWGKDEGKYLEIDEERGYWTKSRIEETLATEKRVQPSQVAKLKKEIAEFKATGEELPPRIAEWEKAQNASTI